MAFITWIVVGPGIEIRSRAVEANSHTGAFRLTCQLKKEEPRSSGGGAMGPKDNSPARASARLGFKRWHPPAYSLTLVMLPLCI